MRQSSQQRRCPRSCSSKCSSSSNRQSRPWLLVLPAGSSNHCPPPELQQLLLQLCQRRQAYRKDSSGEQNALPMTVAVTCRHVRLRVPLVRVLPAPEKQSLATQVGNLSCLQHQSHSHRHELLQLPHQKGAAVLQLWPLRAPAHQRHGTSLRHRSRRRAPRPQRKCILQPDHDHHVSHRTCIQRGLERHQRRHRQPAVVDLYSRRLRGLLLGVPVHHPPAQRHLLTCYPQQPPVQSVPASQLIPQARFAQEHQRCNLSSSSSNSNSYQHCQLQFGREKTRERLR